MLNSRKDELKGVEDLVKGLTDLKDKLAEYRKELFSGEAAMLSPEEAYKAARSEFDTVSQKAIMGDKKSQDALIAISEKFREASLAYNSNSSQYYADRNLIAQAVDQTAEFAGEQLDTATAQLETLREVVKSLENSKQNDAEMLEIMKQVVNTLIAQGNQSGTITQALLDAFARLEQSLDDQTREVARQ